MKGGTKGFEKGGSHPHLHGYDPFADLPEDDPSITTDSRGRSVGPRYSFFGQDGIGTPAIEPVPALPTIATAAAAAPSSSTSGLQPTTVLPTTVQPSSNVGVQTVARAWWDMPGQPVTGELKHSPYGAFYWNNVTASWQYMPDCKWWWFPAASDEKVTPPGQFNPEKSTAAHAARRRP
jgi:hypothetical protein